VWTDIEQSLDGIIEAAAAALVTGIIEAGKWARLIELLAQILVRTPDFDRRFSERFAGMGEAFDIATSRDNINAVRLIELQKMRSAFL
jgi:hypothetical protein